jgi:hypothetical protein
MERISKGRKKKEGEKNKGEKRDKKTELSHNAE